MTTPGPIEVTFRLAVFAPGAGEELFMPGAKVRLIVQLAPAASIPQLLVCLNTNGLVPENRMLLIVIGAVPELMTCKSWSKLVVRTG